LFEQNSINHIRTDLISEFSQSYIPDRIKLGTGNIFQVAQIQPIACEANQYIELAYRGALQLEDWGGGNYTKHWALDLGIYVAVEMDIIERNTQAAKDVIFIENVCTRLIHLYDDFDYVSPTTAEPVEQIFDGEPQLVAHNGLTYLNIIQRYRVHAPVLDYDKLKDTDFDGEFFGTGTGDEV